MRPHGAVTGSNLDEAGGAGVENAAAYHDLWIAINGPVYPERLWRIEFEEVQRG